jgi:hypothetical protein
MKLSFKAKIYKVGINPCVSVPTTITSKMVASKGYIPIKGKIINYLFQQTLVPVKNAAHRLYVNGLMLRGSNAKVGDTVKFTIEQDVAPRTISILMSTQFKKKLEDNNLLSAFKKLIPSRQKEILKYLNYLKTDEARMRNMNKVISELKGKTADITKLK